MANYSCITVDTVRETNTTGVYTMRTSDRLYSYFLGMLAIAGLSVIPLSVLISFARVS